jgi:hypothetical protein
MSLSRAQHGLYRKLWDAVLAHEPAADRLAMHQRLGLPASRADWSNAHFDEWKRACLAISDPGNLDAQLDGSNGPQIRALYALRQLLAAQGLPESYAEATARQMGYRPPLELLPHAALKKLIIALRKQQRREAHSHAPEETRPAPDPDWSIA